MFVWLYILLVPFYYLITTDTHNLIMKENLWAYNMERNFFFQNKNISVGLWPNFIHI